VLGEGGYFTTKLSYEVTQSNLRKTVIRRTEPLLLQAHRLELKGESMRKKNNYNPSAIIFLILLCQLIYFNGF
jgi:hypothetical protein